MTATTTAPPARRFRLSWSPRGGSDRLRADRRLGYLLVAPAVVSLLAVTGYPLLYNLWNSFHHENLTDAAQAHTFSGVSNYSKLFSSSDFVSSLTRTVGFMVVSVAFETVVAVGLALVLHKAFKGRGLVRAAVLIPWAVPTVVSALLWKTMFDPRNGFRQSAVR